MSDNNPTEKSHPPYHARTAEQVLKHWETDSQGLKPDEASRRLQAHGRNELPTPKGRHAVVRFLLQFNNALIYFLLAAAVAALALGHIVDGSVIIAVVLINATVGFIQEGKAENALNAIRNMVSPQANVLRNGERTGVPVEELVPGDIVLLEAGDRVPADLRLLRARGLLIEEAVLTGESVASEKQEGTVEEDVSLGDRACMAYSGTLVASGQGSGVVVATGADTEIGHISSMLGGVQEITTPLLQQINRFGRAFTWVTLAVGALLFLFAIYWRNFEWTEALLAVVALAVGAIPEGLPAVITITLAIGVQRMAARNAITRRLPAVETLGATSVICSDKTGTLTRNEMTARRIVVCANQVNIEGSGYAPEGGGAESENLGDAETQLVRAGLLCNDAHVRCKQDNWTVDGDPMEGALVTLAMKAGWNTDQVRKDWARIDEIPFDAQHRFMATLNQCESNERTIFVKGAPERLLEMCSRQQNGEREEDLNASYWSDKVAEAAAEGERVLGFAYKPATDNVERVDFDEVEDGLVFLGLIGFIDPPRDEAIAAIAECQSAGIAVKMITGDHAATAAAIAQQLGLGDSPKVLTGRELDDIPDEDLSAAIQDTAVFARTSPEHKLRIVRALQSNRSVVAMTGDGVNDAPSLKQANIGIAMGKKGTEAAKEASQMVLLDDNFATIVAAVHEGRTVYDNIRKVAAWTLPTNGGEVFTVMAAILLNFTMPMTPVQILWINMITAVTLGLVLAFEPAEDNVMKRPPRPVNEGLLSPFLVWRVIFVSFIFLAGALAIFFYALSNGYPLDTARTMVVNTIVILEVFYLFNVRYLNSSSFTWRGALGTKPVLIAVGTVIVAQLAFTYAPFMQTLFATQALSLVNGLLILAVGVVAMILLECEKHLMRRLGKLA